MDHERAIWNTGQLQGFLLRCSRYLNLVTPLIHFSCGGPARRTEILTTKITNTVSGLRNLYFINGCLVVLTRYHKGSHQMGDEKVCQPTSPRLTSQLIPRFLTPTLTEDLLRYLAYIRPVEVHILEALGRQEGAAHHRSHLFVHNGTPQSPDSFTSIITSTSLKYFDVALNPSTWRHLQIAISKEFNIRQIMEYGQSANDLQASHSTRTAEQHYALSRDDVQSISDGTFLLFHASSREWQALMGYKTESPGEQLDEDDWRWLKRAKKFTEKTPGKTIDDLMTVVARIEERVATKAITPTPVPVAVSSASISPLTAGHPMPPLNSQPVKPVLMDEHSDLFQTALIHTYGPGAQFRSAWQREGCEKALLAQENLILVGPTSAGKTLFWLLPLVGRMEREKVTVVVVPLRAVMLDLYARAVKLGVNTRIWERSTPINEPLVFVSVETATSTVFGTWLTQVGSNLVRSLSHPSFLLTLFSLGLSWKKSTWSSAVTPTDLSWRTCSTFEPFPSPSS